MALKDFILVMFIFEKEVLNFLSIFLVVLSTLTLKGFSGINFTIYLPNYRVNKVISFYRGEKKPNTIAGIKLEVFTNI